MLHRLSALQKGIVRTALDHWGANAQTDKLFEEMGELTQALVKYRHKGASVSRRNAVLEEIADVKIVLAQMEMLYDEDGKVDRWVAEKLERLKGTLENGGAF